MFEHTFIGLDVHAVNVVAHALNPATGEISGHTISRERSSVAGAAILVEAGKSPLHR